MDGYRSAGSASFKVHEKENTLATAAAKAGMDEKTARKYRRLGKFPSEVKREHDWSGHADAFIDVWDNRERLHSSLGNMSPVEFEAVNNHQSTRLAA